MESMSCNIVIISIHVAISQIIYVHIVLFYEYKNKTKENILKYKILQLCLFIIIKSIEIQLEKGYYTIRDDR